MNDKESDGGSSIKCDELFSIGFAVLIVFMTFRIT